MLLLISIINFFSTASDKLDLDNLNKQIIKVHEDGSCEYKINELPDGPYVVIIRPNGTQEQYFQDRIEYYYINNTVGTFFNH